MKIRYSISVAILAVIVFLTAISTTSVWFLRGSLGGEEGRIEVGYQKRPQILEVIEKIFPGAADKYLGVPLNSFYRLAYVRDSKKEYIAGIPTIGDQVRILQSLATGGWQPHRFLWVVIASRELEGSLQREDMDMDQRAFSFLGGVQRQLSSVLSLRLPVSPLFFIHVAEDAQILDKKVTVYGEIYRSTQLVVTAIYDEASLGKQDKISSSEFIQEGLFVSIQRGELSYIPSKILSELNDTLGSILHFSKTNPDLLSDLPAGTTIGIALLDSDVALGATSHADTFEAVVKKWLGAEQGVRHPFRKAFSLPDKTLGYEYLPSSPSITFSLADKDAACQEALSYDEHLVLCKNSQDASVLASDELLGKSLLEYISSSTETWSGKVGEQIIRNFFPEVSWRALSFKGADGVVRIWIKLK